MSFSAACPSCGAPVAFRSAASVLAVCDYCQSTLIRHDGTLENVGRMASLIADRSPLQRGTEGVWQGARFTLVGRIQLRWGDAGAPGTAGGGGLWNEWHLLFDDGRSGWLSESAGEHVLSFPQPAPPDLPAFAALTAGAEVRLPAGTFTVSNVLTAECVAGEGELPFRVGSGYPAPLADLRDPAGRFATIDYSEQAQAPDGRPLLFVGEAVAPEALRLEHLRDAQAMAAAPTVAARVFRCPGCGAPLSARSPEIETIGCAQCGTVIDATSAAGKALGQAGERQRVTPRIPLGAQGTLRGVPLTVIGFMQRSTQSDGQTWAWREYLLVTSEGATLWLTEYDGHWNLARVQSKVAAGRGQTVRFENTDFKHFETYTARIDYVAGEFPWRARLGETAKVQDYVAPPRLLSREQVDGELTWTLAEYLAPAELQAAFRLPAPLPAPRGVYANQPNPRTARHEAVCRYFWRFFLAAWVIHAALLVLAPGPLLQQPVAWRGDGTLEAGGAPLGDDDLLPGEIVLPRGARRLEVTHDAALSNNWMEVQLTLVNKETGEAWTASRELAYYEGIDDGERWSEGSRSDELVFTGLPPGRYALAEEAELPAGSPPVRGAIAVREAGPRWSSLWVLLIFLAGFPIASRWSAYRFEIARWANSDHPLVTTSDDDD